MPQVLSTSPTPHLSTRECAAQPEPSALSDSSRVGFRAFNRSLPNILIFATGGTIAGSSASNTDATQYTAGVIGIEALVVGTLVFQQEDELY